MYCYLYNADDMLRDVRMGDLEKDVLVARNTLAKVICFCFSLLDIIATGKMLHIYHYFTACLES